MEKKEKKKSKRRSRKSGKLLFLLCLVLFFSIGIPGSQYLFQNYSNGSENEAEKSQEEASFEALKASGEGLYVAYLDVGQGDGIFISCQGHHMMIDGGEAGESQYIYAYLTQQGIEEVEVCVATHPHSDHVGGLSAVFRAANVGRIYTSALEYDSRAFENLKKGSETYSVPFLLLDHDIEFMLGDAQVSLYAPRNEGEDWNNRSIVCRITYGENQFLFTGDMEWEEEQEMLDAGVEVSADVLKVAHHGSSTSSSQEFLERVAPDYAVISVGAGNSYGHPQEDVLLRLELCGAQLYRTDLQGMVQCISDGKEIYWSTEK